MTDTKKAIDTFLQGLNKINEEYLLIKHDRRKSIHDHFDEFLDLFKKYFPDDTIGCIVPVFFELTNWNNWIYDKYNYLDCLLSVDKCVINRIFTLQSRLGDKFQKHFSETIVDDRTSRRKNILIELKNTKMFSYSKINENSYRFCFPSGIHKYVLENLKEKNIDLHYKKLPYIIESSLEYKDEICQDYIDDIYSYLNKNIVNNATKHLSGFAKEILKPVVTHSLYVNDEYSLLYIFSHTVSDIRKENISFDAGLGGIFVLIKKNLLTDDEELIKIIRIFESISDKLSIRITNYYQFKEILINQLKSAIVSILVDSFAHNVSAHSLTALEWWIRSRSKLLEARTFISEKQKDPYLSELEPVQLSKSNLLHIANNAEKFYEFIGLEDSTFNKSFFSLFDLIQFMSDELQEKFLLYNKTQMIKTSSSGEGKYHPRFPVPLDYALWQLLKFIRDKAAFWSGVTRDIAFGGEIRNQYDLLWNDFSNNPLYLGTIARSEEISELNIKLSIFNDDNEIILDGLFAHIDLSIIDWENELFDINNHSSSERTQQQIQPDLIGTSEESETMHPSSKYAFVKITKFHQTLREELSKNKYNIFLPGGVVGKHSFFTLIENTIRNVKHYKDCDDWHRIKQQGLDLYISIKPAWLKNEIKYGKNKELYEISIWLDHKISLYDEKANQENEKIIPLKIRNLLRQPIVDPNGKPRLGGNSQDKICAAMLLNNTFNSVENVVTARDKFYNSSIRAWIEISSEPAIIKKESKGIIKKHFHLWRGDFIFVLKDVRDLEDENISRFKIIYIHPESAKYELLESKARENGVLRILGKNDLEKGIKEINRLNPTNYNIQDIEQKILTGTVQEAGLEGDILYYCWLQKFLYDRPLRILKGKDFTNKLIEHLQFTNPYPDVQDPLDLRFAHGTNTDPANILDFRSHGSLMEHFCQNDQNFKKQILYEFEFVETALLKVCIFDDRLADRIPEHKVKLYDEKLNVKFANELRVISQKAKNQNPWEWETEKVNMKNEYNILIIHLSFIENLKYREDQINEFVERELTITPDEQISKFVLVITTGRGRERWYESLHPKYKNFTIFRPIESLLTAVEDAVSLKDDFQVKYNLAKVIFGS